MLVQSTDHQERARAKLLDQFQDKAYVQAVLAAFLRQVQCLEDCAWEVLRLRNLEDSVGVQLDVIGRIVMRARLGLNDTDYRVALRAQIRINRSSGRPEDLIDVTRLSIPEGFTFTYDESYTATVLIEVGEQPDFNIMVLFSNLVRAKCGGVRLILAYPAEDEYNAFTFAPYSDPQVTIIDPDKGFGTYGDTGGGQFINILTSS